MKFSSTVLVSLAAFASVAQGVSLNWLNRDNIAERHIPFEPEETAGLNKRFFWPKSPEEAEEAAKRQEDQDSSIDKRFWWLIPPPPSNFTKRADTEDSSVDKRFWWLFPPPPSNVTKRADTEDAVLEKRIFFVPPQGGNSDKREEGEQVLKRGQIQVEEEN